MKKRLFAVLLSAGLTFSVMPTGASAASGIILAAESVSAKCKAGTEITVPVRAEQNDGYAAGTVDVKWDSTALTLKSVAYSENAPEYAPAAITSQGQYRASFGDYQATENFTESGDFFSMTFTVAKSASPGDYAIILDNASIFDAELNPVPVSVKAGCVKLTGETAADSMLLTVGSAEVTVGDTSEIKIPVTAKQNPGFAAGTIDLLWDSDALTLSKVTFTKLAPDNASAKIVSDGKYRIAFGSYLADADKTDTGKLFTLVFTAKEDAPAGSYTIMLSNPDILNAKLEHVPVSMKSGAVLLKEETTTTEATTSTTTVSTTEEVVTTTSSMTTEDINTTESTAAESVSTMKDTEAGTESTTKVTETTVTATVSTTADTGTAESDTESTATASDTATEPVSTESLTDTTFTESVATTETTASTEPIDEQAEDFNGDGEVTVADAVLLMRFVTEDKTLTKKQLTAILNAEPDQNTDSLVSIEDVVALLKKLTAT